MLISDFKIENRKSKIENEDGDVAQRESTCLARRGSAVQIRSSPPKEMRGWVAIEILEPVVSGILDCRL